jgi:signal transduction histidine kinase
MFHLKVKPRPGYVFAFCLLVFSYVLIYQSTIRLRKETKSVSHSYIVLNRLELMYSAVEECEAGARGYIISGNASMLAPFYNGKSRIDTLKKEIPGLLADVVTVQNTADTLNGLLDRRLSQLLQGLKMFQAAGFKITDEMRQITPAAISLSDSIRLYITRIASRENKIMQGRQSNLSGFFNNAQFLILISLITAIAAILYSLITYNRESRAKNAANLKAMEYGKQLENNISELEEMNLELKELRGIEKFAATGRIARTIAHEVRNPLTNISLANEQLQEMSSTHPEYTLLLDMISRNAVRINQLVADLLNATKYMQLDTKSVSINKLLDETLELAQDRIELNRIKVEKNYSLDMCEVSVDPERIKLAFLNVIVNAIEAMEKGNGVLHIRTTQKDQKCIVEIADNGVGMDEDTLQKLFEPYFTAKPQGTGLGLTNTQNIILSHKGNIKVKSKPGTGTTFIIILDIQE